MRISIDKQIRKAHTQLARHVPKEEFRKIWYEAKWSGFAQKYDVVWTIFIHGILTDSYHCRQSTGKTLDAALVPAVEFAKAYFKKET